ncbi:hypothetical protein MVEN_02315700 [Mycena venus]|uniref:CxC1-like cysteine cluster associated with KDZ transposases domain-containing protein n=1 Tax=Mycena venus TaxID=2733690 RepID=A0A8H6X4Y2_9AGAR|nr:hypothetical protein MVEN_02315700 [Mycena venus]
MPRPLLPDRFNSTMGRNKRKGLSAGHSVSYGTQRSSKKAKTVSINVSGSTLKRQEERYKEQLASLSFTQREELFGLGSYDIEMPPVPQGFDDDGWQDTDSDEEEAFQRLPPGEEGLYHSNAGKEEAFHEIFQKCKPGRGDPRRRTMRIQTMIDSWKEKMPALVDAYLTMKHEGPLVVKPDEPFWAIDVMGFEENGPRRFTHFSGSGSTNETLIRHGYLGASPDRVSLAFPIHLLEIFRQIHRVCPRYSMDAFSKTLTNLHNVTPNSALPDQLRIAYDTYLEIMRQVDARVDHALGRNSEWRIKNICAPCFYTTEHEHPLYPRYLASLDGNNSLKLIDSVFRAGILRPDDRTSNSFRWLTSEQVDIFKNEVADSQKRARLKKSVAGDVSAHTQSPATAPAPTAATPSHVMAPTPTSSHLDYGEGESLAADVAEDTAPAANVAEGNEDIAWLNVNELDADESEELAKGINACVDRWKAAAPEARKKMHALFAVSGIFLSVCRHGHILVMCDMIRSGELMKYPLAIVKELLDRYGPDGGLGYDIMCAFYKTLLRSSLGARVVAMRLRGVVPSFHGHAHNRTCQIEWHPLYVEGVGLEDFEECERTFCKSNHLASITRMATAFHRQQEIDEHFYFHDFDKHLASGNFIYQNYRQALEKIAANRAQLTTLEIRLGTAAEDYEKDHQDEIKYFEGLRSEPQNIQIECDYVELLLKLHVSERDSDSAKSDFQQLDHLIITKGYTRPDIARVRTRYRTTWAKFLAVQETVCRFEEEHSIEERWSPESKEYQDALLLMTEKRYRTALAELERLVVARLFELTKLNMSGVAYKLRDKISKALKTRAEAIRRALKEYNSAALALSPPRDRLSFAEVLNTTTLAEFDLLRDTRQDIRVLPWTQPARREAMVLYFGIKRAKEEIRRLNVEIRRTITYMVDEHVDYYQAISSHLIRDSPLAAELSHRWSLATNFSTAIARRFAQCSRLTGFSGSLFPGIREGRDSDFGSGIPSPAWLTATLRVVQTDIQIEEPTEATKIDADSTAQEELDESGLDMDEDDLVTLMENLNAS